MPSRIKDSGYVCMYGSKTFVTRFENVAILLNIAEEIRKQSGSEKASKLLKAAWEEESKLSRMYLKYLRKTFAEDEPCLGKS